MNLSNVVEPRLVLIGGLPASGKNYLGSIVASRIPNAILLDKDRISEHMTRALIALRRSNGNPDITQYLQTVRECEYQSMLTIALDNVRVGKCVICIAPFSMEFVSSTWPDFFRSIDPKWLRKIWIDADEPAIKNRMQQRASASDLARLAAWSDFSSNQLFSCPAPASDMHIINNRSDREQVVEEMVSVAVRFICEDLRTPTINSNNNISIACD